MAKRRRSRNTIRTKDEFPNFLVGLIVSIQTLGEDFFITRRFNTPLPRLKTIGNRATVMELLWVEFFFGDLPALFTNQTLEPISIRWQLSIGQAPTISTVPVSDARVFAQQEISSVFQGFPSGFFLYVLLFLMVF